MFCKNCGKELTDGAAFCSACGAKQTGILYENGRQGADVNAEGKGTGLGAETVNPDKEESAGGIFARIWNSPLFTRMAIKFGNILEILEGVIFLILSRFLFKEGGFWGTAFGILMLLGGIGSCFSGITSLLSRRKNHDDGTLDEKDIRKKKRNFCIGIPVMIIALVIVFKSGGGSYAVIRSISFDDMGPETIGELLDKNIKGAEWSKEKLDGGSERVYVEGYCPAYDETVRIEFYYEKSGGSYEVELKGMYWPESGEEFNTFESAIVWASFYE